MAGRFDLILGRKTYDIWSDYWPHHSLQWPQVMQAVKYVASHTRPTLTWDRSHLLDRDLEKNIRVIKNTPGPELRVYGSSGLFPALIRADLVDDLRLRVFPIILGNGKKLFSQESTSAKFTLEQCISTPKGVLMLDYRRNADE